MGSIGPTTVASVLAWSWRGWRYASIWIPLADVLVQLLRRYPGGQLTDAQLDEICGQMRAILGAKFGRGF